MSDIHWLNNAVCHAKGKQWFSHASSSLMDSEVQTETTRAAPLDCLIKQSDYQLNEIRTGDYIPASELDTEQKYNEVVEVFGLFGFGKHESHLGYNKHNSLYFTATNVGYCYSVTNGRQLTYHQIIAIGKLKRMMLERAIPAVEFGVVEYELIDHQTLGNRVTTNKYEREITDRQGNSATVDVYDVIIAYGVTCPATQHAIKKLLCTGDRGHKDTLTDLSEARDAITRAIELN